MGIVALMFPPIRVDEYIHYEDSLANSILDITFWYMDTTALKYQHCNTCLLLCILDSEV